MTIGDFINEALEQLGILLSNLPFLLFLALGTLMIVRFVVIRNHHTPRRAITQTISSYAGVTLWVFITWLDLGDSMIGDEIALRGVMRALLMTSAGVLGIWIALPLSKMLEPHNERLNTRIGKWLIARGEKMVRKSPTPNPVMPVTQDMVQAKFEELKAALASQLKEGNGENSGA